MQDLWLPLKALTGLQYFEHSRQKTLPQDRQWCRRRPPTSNSARQSWQRKASESGTQLEGWSWNN